MAESHLIERDFDGTEKKRSKPYDLRPLKKEEVERIIAHEIKDSINYFDGTVASDQSTALNRYLGGKLGNEVEDRSQIILTDTRECVEWVMPSLMRMLCGSRQVVRYVPRTLEDEDWARQATKFALYSTRSGPASFTAMYNWIKDALIEKVGAVVVYFDDKENRDLERYSRLSEEELDELISGDDVEVVEIEQILDTEMQEAPPVPVPDPQTGQPTLVPQEPIEVETVEYNVRIRRLKRNWRIVVEGIPQEEFLIAGRCRELTDACPFVGRRYRATNSDLVAMGIPPYEVDELPRANAPKSHDRRDDTYYDEVDRLTRPDWAAQEIWLTECWARIDEDGDGYTELRHIVAAGDTSVKILVDEEVSFIPIATLCPIPMPHRFYGFSLADLIMDIEVIRITLMRQMLDNIYLTNNQRQKVIDGEVNLEDLLSGAPGGIVRVDRMDALEPLAHEQLGPNAWHLMNYLDQVKQNRSGTGNQQQGMPAEGGETATGWAGMLEQANQRVELIARIMGETGFTRLYQIFLKVMAESDVEDLVVRLTDDEWVPLQAEMWRADLDVQVEVGLGSSQSPIRVDNLMLLHDLQKQIMEVDGRMVTPENLYNALERVPEAMGFTADGMFFTRPDEDEPPPEPPPDPKMLEVQQKQEAEAVRLQIERETLQFRHRQLEVERELKIMQMQTQIKVAQIQGAYSVDQAEVHAHGNIASAEHKGETDLARELLRPGPGKER